MNAQHTPGPWAVGASYGHHSVRIEAPTAIVGTVRDSITVGTDKGAPVYAPLAEGQANARLIAAAPDLLEALQALMDDDMPADVMRWSDACDKARAAIAKATGSAA